eukprot:13797769-Ditylum_brightwellii.AAC.1
MVGQHRKESLHWIQEGLGYECLLGRTRIEIEVLQEGDSLSGVLNDLHGDVSCNIVMHQTSRRGKQQ